MTRVLRFWSVIGLGCVVGAGTFGNPAAVGQVAPPPLPTPPGVPGDLDDLGRRMSGAVQGLGVAIANDLGDSTRGRQLLADTQELGQAVGDFQASLRDRTDRYQVRRAYSGIDSSWHHLLGRLGQPGSSTPAIDRAAQDVAQTDAVLHRSLGLNDYPAGYYGGGNQPLSGVADLQRLSHALVDRAQALVATVRAEFPGPGGARLSQEAMDLDRAADRFHDALDLNGQIDATTQNSFSGVSGISDQFAADLAQAPESPRARDAWQAYKSTEVLVRQSLGLPNQAATLTNTVLVPTTGGGSPVAPLADQLVQQVGAFVEVFSQTAGAVPEGRQFLADSQALQAAAANFRDDTARGLNPSQLAYEFRDVDAVWQRLARRTERIARGRTGPNIQQVGKMGQTIAEIHRLLGIPGYAPVVGQMVP